MSRQGNITFFTAAKLFAKFVASTNLTPKAQWSFVWNGLKIAIENPLGSVREGKSKDGTPWRRRMTCDYGYFEDYKGFDGDELDVLIGPDLTSEAVFVVDQKNAEGGFDESRVPDAA